MEVEGSSVGRGDSLDLPRGRYDDHRSHAVLEILDDNPGIHSRECSGRQA